MLVMYHYVRDADNTEHPGIVAISEAEFNRQVEHLLRLHEPVSPQLLLDCVRSGNPLPSDAFLLTFDDGIIDHWERVLPVLARHKIKSIFAPIGDPYVNKRVPFVQKNQFVRGRIGEDRLPDVFIEKAQEIMPGTDVRRLIEEAPIDGAHPGSDKYQMYKHAINATIPWDLGVEVIDELFTDMIGDEEQFISEQYMTSRHIVELRAMGHTIASHTMRHVSLPRLSRVEQAREVRTSLDWLEHLLGERPVWLDYPYGEFNDDSQLISSDLGVEISYSAFPPLWSSHAERFRVPRVDTRDLPTEVSAPMSEWSRALRDARNSRE
jgi:peptidoglycan/xylan/chitin deacetylase (PgdA/CDA1 family)